MPSTQEAIAIDEFEWLLRAHVESDRVWSAHTCQFMLRVSEVELERTHVVLLNVLLSVQDQTKQCAEQLLNVVAGYCLCDASLNVLRPIVG